MPFTGLKGFSSGGDKVLAPQFGGTLKSDFNLSTIIKYLDSFANANTGAINAIIDDKPVLSEWWKGFTHKKEFDTGKVILKFAGMSEPVTQQGKILKGTLAIAGRTLIDPLLYLQPSLVLKAGEKFAKEIPLISSMLKRVQNSKVSKMFNKAFNPMAEVPKSLFNIVKTGNYLTKGKVQKIQQSRTLYAEILDKLPEVDKVFLNEMLEKPAGTNLEEAFKLTKLKFDKLKLPSNISSAAEFEKPLKLAIKFRTMIERYERERGVITPQEEYIGYLLHSLHSDTKDAIAKVYPNFGRIGVKELLSPKHKSMLERSFTKIDVPESYINFVKTKYPKIFNKYLSEVKIGGTLEAGTILKKDNPIAIKVIESIDFLSIEDKTYLQSKKMLPQRVLKTIAEIEVDTKAGKMRELIGDNKVDKFLIADLPTLQVIRGARAVESANKMNVMNQAVKQFGVEEGREGLQTSEIVTKYLKKNVYFEPEIANYLDTLDKIGTSDPLNKYLTTIWDKIQNMWKWWTIVPIPAQISRSAVGHFFNSWMVGADTPRAYTIAIDAIRGRTGIIEGTKMSYQTLKNMFNKYAIYGRNIINVEGNIVGLTAQLHGKGGIYSSKFFMAKIGSMIEDSIRAGSFTDGILFKKMTPLEARLRVAKGSFDYDDITEFERKTLRRVMPFYTWTRKNIPLQIELLLTKPMYPITVDRILSSMEIPEAPNEKYMPEYLKESSPIFLGKDKEGNVLTMLLGNVVSFYDLESLFRPGKFLYSHLSPLVTNPIETFSNFSQYFQKSIERYPGQSINFSGLYIPARWVNVVRNLRIITEMDRLNPGSIFGTNDTPGIFGVKRNQVIETPLILRILNAFAGMRLKIIDTQSMYIHYVKAYNEDIAALKMYLNFAKKETNYKEMNRIQILLDKYNLNKPNSLFNPPEIKD